MNLDMLAVQDARYVVKNKIGHLSLKKLSSVGMYAINALRRRINSHLNIPFSWWKACHKRTVKLQCVHDMILHHTTVPWSCWCARPAARVWPSPGWTCSRDRPCSWSRTDMSYLAVKMAPVRDVDFGEARTHEHRGKTSTLRLDYKYDTILIRIMCPLKSVYLRIYNTQIKVYVNIHSSDKALYAASKMKYCVKSRSKKA